MSQDAPAPAALAVARPRGRPRKAATEVVNVRIPVHVYEAYIKTAFRVDEDVRTIMRNILTYYAPKI